MDITEANTFNTDKEVKLSGKEYAIMEYFIKHEGEVVHRYELLDEVWRYDTIPTTRTVDNFVLDLRKKLEVDPSKPKYIISIRGVGYRFQAQP